MSTQLTMFSTVAYDLLKAEFENNILEYQKAMNSNSLWAWVSDFLSKKNISEVEIPLEYAIDGRLEEKSFLESDKINFQKMGIYLYETLGDLPSSIMNLSEFWSLLAHKYYYQCLTKQFKNDSAPIKHFFLTTTRPRVYRDNYFTLYYLAARWTASALEEAQKRNHLSNVDLQKAFTWIEQQTDAIHNIVDRTLFCNKNLRDATFYYFINAKLNQNPENERIFDRNYQRLLWKHLSRLYGGNSYQILSFEDNYSLIDKFLKN